MYLWAIVDPIIDFGPWSVEETIPPTVMHRNPSISWLTWITFPRGITFSEFSSSTSHWRNPNIHGDGVAFLQWMRKREYQKTRQFTHDLEYWRDPMIPHLCGSHLFVPTGTSSIESCLKIWTLHILFKSSLYKTKVWGHKYHHICPFIFL